MTDTWGKIGDCSNSRSDRILYVTPEIADFVKAGGLGDVSAAFPRALRRNCDARVLMPAYRAVLPHLTGRSAIVRLPGTAALPPAELYRVDMADGLPIYAVRCDALFDRAGSPYGQDSGSDWPDNDERFARLCLAAAQMAQDGADPQWRPDFLHLNDWPAALTAGYLRWRGGTTPSLLTIHNLAHQGLFGADSTARLGIPRDAFSVNGVEFYGKLSFLKTGIVYANHVTTVSATYAREITMPEFGCGLDGLLRRRAEEGCLSGIVNGIDERNLQELSLADGWAGKSALATRIRRKFGLAVSRGPLFAIVSRLVHQKGLDLVIDAAQHIVEKRGQIVVTGSGDPRLEDAMRSLARRHPDAIGVRIGFDEHDASVMYAGSDFLLMPSRFEPCGLSQLYAQRCGSLPIAHNTGGLADTIEDGVTGFLFDDYSVRGFVGAIGRALRIFASTKRLDLMRRVAMRRDSNWAAPAAKYLGLFANMRAAD